VSHQPRALFFIFNHGNRHITELIFFIVLSILFNSVKCIHTVAQSPKVFVLSKMKLHTH
jgi:hypothetical protein